MARALPEVLARVVRRRARQHPARDVAAQGGCHAHVCGARPLLTRPHPARTYRCDASTCCAPVPLLPRRLMSTQTQKQLESVFPVRNILVPTRLSEPLPRPAAPPDPHHHHLRGERAVRRVEARARAPPKRPPGRRRPQQQVWLEGCAGRRGVGGRGGGDRGAAAPRQHRQERDARGGPRPQEAGACGDAVGANPARACRRGAIKHPPGVKKPPLPFPFRAGEVRVCVVGSSLYVCNHRISVRRKF